MKIPRFVLAIVLSIFIASPVMGQGNTVQLSLIPTIQLVPENQSVSLIRLGVYGKNTRTEILDVGIVTQNTSGESVGIQWSFAGIQDDFTGWQASAIINYSTGSVTGLMTSSINYTHYFKGIQFGFVNYTKTAKGIQIGLVNLIEKGGFMPIFPFFNFAL